MDAKLDLGLSLPQVKNEEGNGLGQAFFFSLKPGFFFFSPSYFGF